MPVIIHAMLQSFIYSFGISIPAKFIYLLLYTSSLDEYFDYSTNKGCILMYLFVVVSACIICLTAGAILHLQLIVFINGTFTDVLCCIFMMCVGVFYTEMAHSSLVINPNHYYHPPLLSIEDLEPPLSDYYNPELYPRLFPELYGETSSLEEGKSVSPKLSSKKRFVGVFLTAFGLYLISYILS